MTISKDRRELYETLPMNEIAAVDEAFKSAQRVLMLHGVPVAKDDRAENLVGALARYVVESRR